MIINTDTLIRLLSNMTLFCGPKTQTGGVIHFSTSNHPSVLRATASDDYVIIQQEEQIEPTDVEEDFFLPHKYAKELIQELDSTDSDTVNFIDGGHGVPNPNPELWKAVLQAPTSHDRPDSQLSNAEPMAIRPERFAKFSRLKAEKEYPLDFVIERCKVLNGKKVFFFRYGPKVKGVLSPILRSVIEEAFADEEGVLWEE